MMRVLLVLALLAAGCCKPGDTSGLCRVEAAAVDCAKAGQSTVFQGVLTAVVDALAKGAEGGWMGILSALEGKGVEYVVCAVEQAVSAASAPPVAGRLSASLARFDPATRERIAARGATYLKAKGRKL